MTEIPKVHLGRSDVLVTRLISGGNPFCGNSHFSPEMNEDMLNYFTDKQVVTYLHDLQSSGINTIQARGDYHRILYRFELFKREGGRLHWIAQTASEMHDVFENIRILTAAGVAGIYHHGSRTDNLWHEGQINEVNEHLKCIRDCGVQVGLGTHIPEVIEYAEEKEWDIDFYMASVYNISRKPRESVLVSNTGVPKCAEETFLPEDPPHMYRIIRSTDKMCLAFKILGASRLCRTQTDVENAFKTAFENIKSKDAVVVGMFPKYEDQISLNIKYTLRALNPKNTYIY